MTLTTLELEVLAAIAGGQDPWKLWSERRAGTRVVSQAVQRLARKGALDYRRFTRPSPASVTEAGRACLHPAESTP